MGTRESGDGVGRRHGRRVWRRGLALIGVAAVVALAGYFGYAAYEGSRQLVNPEDVSRFCYTPGQLGWAYEAINYDKADDLRLASDNGDMTNCADQGAAGDEVVARDGTRLAGWYIPAADPDPAEPTIVLVHGLQGNKSERLFTAATLHRRYNLLVMDLRNTGRSSGAQHTVGVLEQYDVKAMLDWLVTTKNPQHIAVLGLSAGAAATLALARTDDRIEAFILDSVHARSETFIAQRVKAAGHPAYPATWATLLGFWMRTGYDIRSVDPIDSLAFLGNRPLLLLHGTADTTDIPSESADLMYAEAQRLGLDVTLRYCEGAAHAAVVVVCEDEYGAWVSSFLVRVFPADR